MLLVCDDVVGKDPWGDVPLENAFLKGNLHKTLRHADTARVLYADNPAETIAFIKNRVTLYERVLKTASFKELIQSGLLNDLCHNNSMITKEVLDLRHATLSLQDALHQLKQVVRGNLLFIRATIPQSESPTNRRPSSRRRLNVSTAPAHARATNSPHAATLPSPPPSESNLTLRLFPPPTDLVFLSRPWPREDREHHLKWGPSDMPVISYAKEHSVKRTPRIRFRHPRLKPKHAELARGFGETTDDWPELNGPPGSIVPSGGVLEKSTNWELGPRGCFYLRVLRPRRSWKNAVEACRALAPGAHLADPESLEGEIQFALCVPRSISQ